MKTNRNIIVIALAIGLGAFCLGAQAMGVDVAAIFAANPDMALSLSALSFLGETKNVTLDDVKGMLQDMTRDHATAIKEAKETTEKAIGEVKEFKTITTATNEELKKVGEKAVKVQADLVELQQKMDKVVLQVAAGGGSARDFKSIGMIVIESEEYKEAAKIGESGKPEMKAVKVGSFHKTAITNATTLDGNQPLVVAQRADFVKPAERPLAIRDLLPIRGTQSNLVQFAKENVFTNNAAIQYASPQPESAAYENVTKPESAITYTLADAAVRTIAHWIPASRQVLSDAPMLQGMIEDRLMYGVKYVEEDEVLNGDGTAGHLNGLMHQATAYAGAGAVSADQQLDTLLRAMTQCFTNSLFAPDATVLNPVDWTKIRLIKDTTGRYVFGDPNSNQAPSVWGQRLVQSLSIAATRFLVGAFQPGAALWDREDATIRIAEQHSDFFVRNMVAILAEERLALTVYRPAAFIRGNFN
jgi:HK97 family phage major capsid protein